MSGHTPGPWVAEPCRSGWFVVSMTEPYSVVDTADEEGRYGPIAREADARIIAAAPDLLAALQNLLPTWMPNIEKKTPGLAESIRAAIAKAVQP